MNIFISIISTLRKTYEMFFSASIKRPILGTFKDRRLLVLRHSLQLRALDHPDQVAVEQVHKGRDQVVLRNPGLRIKIRVLILSFSQIIAAITLVSISKIKSCFLMSRRTLLCCAMGREDL